MPIRPCVELTSKRTPFVVHFLVRASLTADKLARSSDLDSKSQGSELGAALRQFVADLPPSTHPAILQALVENSGECVGSDSMLHQIIRCLSAQTPVAQACDGSKRGIESGRGSGSDWLQDAAL